VGIPVPEEEAEHSCTKNKKGRERKGIRTREGGTRGGALDSKRGGLKKRKNEKFLAEYTGTTSMEKRMRTQGRKAIERGERLIRLNLKATGAKQN